MKPVVALLLLLALAPSRADAQCLCVSASASVDIVEPPPTGCTRRVELGGGITTVGGLVQGYGSASLLWMIEGFLEIGLAATLVPSATVEVDIAASPGMVAARGEVEVSTWWYAGVPVGVGWRPHERLALGAGTLIGFGQVTADRVDVASEEGSTAFLAIEPFAHARVRFAGPFHAGLRGGYRFTVASDLPQLQDRSLAGWVLAATLVVESR